MTLEEQLRKEWEEWRTKNAGMYKADDIGNYFISTVMSLLQERADAIRGKKLVYEKGLKKGRRHQNAKGVVRGKNIAYETAAQLVESGRSEDKK